MSIVGLGTDIVAVARMARLLERHGDRFLARCFGPDEAVALARRSPADRAAGVAGRWAAKEAALKALGGSIAHIPYRSIRVAREAAGGAPRLQLTGAAAAALAARGGRHLHLTISHEREYAVATVVIET